MSTIRPIETTYVVLRFTDSVGDCHQYVGRDSRTTDITDARNCSEMVSEKRIKFYLECVQRFRCGLDGLEWVKVKKTTTHTTMPMNEDKLMEIRRSRALAKLTEDDVQALEVEKFAIYDKLKNHNVDTDDEEDDDYVDYDFDDDILF
jgi:hypothetical protein